MKCVSQDWLLRHTFNTCKVLPNLEIIFLHLKTLKPLSFLGPGLLDEKLSVWPSHCNTGLFSADMLPSELEFAIEFLRVSLGQLSDIQNCSAHYIFRLLLIKIRSQVESSSQFHRLSWMTILLSVYEELSNMSIRSVIIFSPRGL